jgi:hypothetical protein
MALVSPICIRPRPKQLTLRFRALNGNLCFRFRDPARIMGFRYYLGEATSNSTLKSYSFPTSPSIHRLSGLIASSTTLIYLSLTFCFLRLLLKFALKPLSFSILDLLSLDHGLRVTLATLWHHLRWFLHRKTVGQAIHLRWGLPS